MSGWDVIKSKQDIIKIITVFCYFYFGHLSRLSDQYDWFIPWISTSYIDILSARIQLVSKGIWREYNRNDSPTIIERSDDWVCELHNGRGAPETLLICPRRNERVFEEVQRKRKKKYSAK